MGAAVLLYADVAQGRPFHAALVPVPTGWRNGQTLHRHGDFHELVYVTSGQGVHRVGGAEVPLRPGDIVLARPRDEHMFAGLGRQGLYFVNIAFPTHRWHAFTDLAGVSKAHHWDRAVQPPTAHDEGRALITAFADALTAHANGPRALDLMRLWSTVVPVLEAASDDADARPRWLVDACTALATEENLRAGLPRLLRMAAVSHGHLARSMAVHYGCTPVEFVTERRLTHAALLLGSTTEPIGRIADRCGFSSQSYFGRRFRQRFDSTPRAYREQAYRAVVP